MDDVRAGWNLLCVAQPPIGQLLRQGANVGVLLWQCGADYSTGISDRLCGEFRLGLECLELLRPAAEPAGPDLPRIQRTVVFTQRPAAGAVLLAVSKIGRQLSNRVALGITAAAAQLFARLAAGKSII